MGKKKKNSYFYGYFECDLVVPDELKAKYANLSLFFKNTVSGRSDIREYMQSYATEKS